MPAAGVVVSPSALTAYGTAIGNQEGQLQLINRALRSEQLPADAFGKLPEAGDLYRTYTEHAADVVDVTGKLPGQIDAVARSLLDTAEYYTDLEGGLTRGITEILGTGGGGGGTGSPSSTGGQAAAGFAAIIDDSAQAYGWISSPETGLPALAVQNLFPPSGWISGGISEGVDFIINHVPELPRLLDKVTGDLAALKASAGVWHDMGTRLSQVISEMKAGARNLPQEWGGDASKSFGTFMGNVTGALEELAALMGQTQKILEEAAAEAHFAQQTITMIITEVIEWFLGSIAVDVLTAGLATGIEALASAGFVMDKLEEAAQAESKLASAYRALLTMLKSFKAVDKLATGYTDLKDAEGLDKVTKFMKMGDHLNDELKAGKLINLRLFGDSKLAGAAKVFIDSGRHGPNMEAVRAATEVGEAGVNSRIAVSVVSGTTNALSGLPTTTGVAGIAGTLASGAEHDLEANGQGAANAAGLGAPVPNAPQFNKIWAMVNPDKPPPKEH